MATRVIDAILRMKDDGFTKTFKNSIDLMAKYGREGKAVRKTIEQQGKAMVGLGKTMTAAVTVPLAGMAVASVKNFQQVDKTMRLVEATMGEAKWATADLNKALDEAAMNSIFTKFEGADAILNFARQGFDAKESMDMLTPSMNLAAGTMTDLSTVTSGLGNALKMFEADSSESARYADILARAQASANTTTTDLFEGLTAAGTMFKTVGWDISDAATAVGIFGDAGLGASEGMTAMRTGLMRLASPKAAGAKAMEQYGIEIFDATGKMKDFAEVQQILHNAFEQMGSDQERLVAADAIFGKNQGNNWLTLLSAAPDKVKELREEIEKGNNSAEKMAEALMTPMEKLKSAFDVMQNGIGKQLNPALEPVLTKITDIINAFNHMGDEGQQRIIRIAAAAAAIGPALIIVGKLTIGFSKLLGAMSVIGKAGGVVQAALGGIAATPVIAGIAAVVGVVALLATHWDKAKETMSQFQWVFDGLSKNFEQFKTSISPVTAALGEFAKAVWDCLGDSLATVVGGAVTVFAGFLSTVLGVANGVIGAIGRMKDFVNEAFEAIANSPVGKAASAISSVLGAAAGAGGAHSGGIGKNAAGTSSWRGGLTMVHEKGGEIMDLPQGTRIYPAERSANMMRSAGVTISIPKLADQIVIREDADIDKLGDAIVRKIALASGNMGGGIVGSMA